MDVFSGSALMRREYLTTILWNMMKNPIRTTRVMRISHHKFPAGMRVYAEMPLMVMMTPGIPHMAAAT